MSCIYILYCPLYYIDLRLKFGIQLNNGGGQIDYSMRSLIIMHDEYLITIQLRYLQYALLAQEIQLPHVSFDISYHLHKRKTQETQKSNPDME